MTDTKAVATRPIDKLKAITGSKSVQEQFKNALGKHSDLFVASIIDIYGSDTYLQGCDPGQVVAECLKAATLKLPLNKALGFAYIVPFKKKGKQVPVFTVGYKGFIQLAMRTGLYKYINAGPVYEGELVSNDKLSGAIDLSGEKTTEKITGYFAYIKTLNGFEKTVYMTADNAAAHGEAFSKSYSYATSPWKTDFDAMATKTCIRALLSKYGIMSVEMAGPMSRAFELDNVTPEAQLRDDIDSTTEQIIDIKAEEVVGPEKTAEDEEIPADTASKKEDDGIEF